MKGSIKLAVIGAGGVRTPLMVNALLKRQDQLELAEVALMDIDGAHLDIIGALTAPMETPDQMHFKLTRTTDARQALQGADFVITTFRVGGIQSRVIDERVPLSHGFLGQETTGPGGFAMGLRSIPVLLDYVRLMGEVCPDAWLVNFANPSGMMIEGVLRAAGWKRSVGICDGPSSMLNLAAAVIDKPVEDVYFEYFGLNHLGWARSIRVGSQDYLPQLIGMIQTLGGIPGLPFDPKLIASLGMIPNEYLYYYYYSRQAVQNILKAGRSRGEQVASLNQELFAELGAMLQAKEIGYIESMAVRYYNYLDERGGTYMAAETGQKHDLAVLGPKVLQAMASEGYADVALNVIEALLGRKPARMILNVPNQGAVHGMDAQDVVEVLAQVSHDQIQPLAVGAIPDHCLALMKEVKHYERLTIEAAVEGSYEKALLALALHPLVRDYTSAKMILDEYCEKHGEYFPQLK